MVEEQEKQEDVFSLIYNSTPLTISRFKFALYSAKFRSIPEFLTSNSLTITGDAPLAVFSEFIKGAQGYPIDLKDEYIYDLLALCEEWQTPTLNEIIVHYIKQKPDYDQICERLSQMQSESLPSSDLEEVLANNLNTVLNLPSFQNFPLPVIARILNNPEIVVDAHLLYKFIMSMFEKYEDEASILAPALDIRKLTAEEAQKFLSSPHLVPSFLNQSLVPITVQMMHDNEQLQQRINKTDNVLKSALERLDQLESRLQNGNFDAPIFVNNNNPYPNNNNENPIPSRNNNNDASNSELSNRIIELETMVSGNNRSIESIQTQIIEQQKSFKDQLDEIEKKAHRDVRKTNKIVNGLTRKAVAYDKLFNEVKVEQNNTRNGIADISKVANNLQNEIMLLKTKMKQIKTVDLSFAGRPFYGIMKTLSVEARQNAHLAGIVNITASSSDHNEPYQVIDMDWDDLFFTENKANQWIQFDFKEKSVKLDHYTIKTHKYPSNFPHLKYWVIEGSNDENSWDEIDRRAITVLNGKNKFQTFPCKKADGTYRFVRLRQTGMNAKNTFVLAVTNIELFGQVYIPGEE